MGVIFESGYTLPGSDQPLTHARIAHSGTWATSGTITASTTAAGYFESAPDDSLTYEYWKPTALPADWENETGSFTADYCAVASHDLFSTGCSVKVQYWDGASWVDIIGTTVVADNSPLFFIFEPVTADKFRLRITSGTGNPEIGVIRFGEAMQMTQPVYGGIAPPHLNRNTVLTTNNSETGQYLGRSVRRVALPFSFPFAHLKAAWVYSTFREFVLSVESEPFFMAWRPETFTDVFYGFTEGPVQASAMGVNDFWQASFSGKALAYD